MFKLLHYGDTNVGRERKNNEDTFRIAPEAGVFLVCDGMGGHASGEIASQITADVMVRFLAMDRYRPEFRWPAGSLLQQTEETRALDAAVRAANREVFAAAQANPMHKGMGTTVVGIYAGPNRIGVVHVGDSRIYRLRGGELEQLTDDHSLLNHYIRTRPMSAQQIRSFAGKNVIVRAVGLRDNVEPDAQTQEYHKDDVYLLCTDGLNDMVDDEQIGEIMLANVGNLAKMTAELIDAALQNGGKDNVTALVLQVVEVPDMPRNNPFDRRTVPMNAAHFDASDTQPGVAVDGLVPDDEEEQPIIEVETMPEIRVTLLQPKPAMERTQPVRPMRPEDFFAAGHTPPKPPSQETTDKVIKDAPPVSDDDTDPNRQPMELPEHGGSDEERGFLDAPTLPSVPDGQPPRRPGGGGKRH